MRGLRQHLTAPVYHGGGAGIGRPQYSAAGFHGARLRKLQMLIGGNGTPIPGIITDIDQ